MKTVHLALDQSLCIKHNGKMKSHKDIIAGAGGVKEFCEKIGVSAQDHGRFWLSRDSIPAAYWMKVADAGLASLADLAAPVAMKQSESQPS